MTKNRQRDDIHRPSAILPEDYIEIAFLPHGDDPGSALYRAAQRVIIEKHMAAHGGHWSGHEHGGSCEICGNVNAMTFIVFWHPKSNTYIRAGSNCADKLGMSYDKDGYNLFRAKIADERQRRAGLAKARTLLSDKGLDWAWLTFCKLAGRDIVGNLVMAEGPVNPQCVGCGTELGVGSHYSYNRIICGACGVANEPPKDPFTRQEHTAFDIVDKLVRYGSLSEAQYGLLAKLPQWLAESKAKEAARAQENAARAAVSQHLGNIGDRLTFTATVRFAKFFENEVGNRFSGGWTLTVLDDEQGNVLVWKGSGFAGVERGTKITFKGTVKAHTERDGVKQTQLTRCKI